MAAQDISANLTNPAQRNVVGALDALMIEKFDGRVHMHEQKESITDAVFDFKPLVGTDTMSNAAMGDPTLQSVVPGVEPLGKEIEVGDQIVQVKTPILARVVIAMLAQVQDRLGMKSRTPLNFGRKIAKIKDEILLHQCVKSAMKTTGAGEVSDMPAGTDAEMVAGSDEIDSTKFEALIMGLAQSLAEKEVDIATGKLYVAPAQYFTLLKNDKLTSADFSKGNGHYAQAGISVTSGMPIVMTNRLSQVADDGSVAGTNGALMGANYHVSSLEADVVGVFAMAESIMVAQSIPLTSDVYWDQRLLTWFIDAYLAFGAAPDRPDKTAVLRKYSA
ncbi:MAG: hypothetical protein JRC86_10980 [Deltaproteobacteria bacterium]|nr:hypothetical protein [Deltaproteobacteria bacterium]